jgi:hypothetical protein
LAGRFDAITLGHANINNGDIGMQGNRFFHRFATIRGLANNAPTPVGVEDLASSSTYQGVIVGN